MRRRSFGVRFAGLADMKGYLAFCRGTLDLGDGRRTWWSSSSWNLASSRPWQRRNETPWSWYLARYRRKQRFGAGSLLQRSRTTGERAAVDLGGDDAVKRALLVR